MHFDSATPKGLKITPSDYTTTTTTTTTTKNNIERGKQEREDKRVEEKKDWYSFSFLHCLLWRERNA